MKTRTEYMSSLPKYGTAESTAAHRAYYAQFVTPHVKALVREQIGVERLKESADKSFNDIPLSVWDSFWCRYSPGLHIQPGAVVSALLKEAGEGNSASTGTCILKEAARQLVEESSSPHAEAESLFAAILAAGIKYASHATDLYLPDTAEARAILARFPLNERNATRFTNQVEGGTWIDVPFAYLPAWEAKQRKGGAS